jgi:hypothetical protein
MQPNVLPVSQSETGGKEINFGGFLPPVQNTRLRVVDDIFVDGRYWLAVL